MKVLNISVGTFHAKRNVNIHAIVLFKSLPHNQEFLATFNKKAFENIVGQGENAGNQHFLLFPQCFLLDKFHVITITSYKLPSTDTFHLNKSKSLAK